MDVSTEHALAFEEAGAKGKMMVSLDWTKYFASIDRGIGFELMRRLMGNSSTGNKFLKCQEKMLASTSYRFKV